MIHSFLNYVRQLYERRIWIALVAFVVLMGTAVRTVSTNNLQHDFRTYYYAVQAHLLNLNPYDLNTLSQVAGYEIYFPFFYPPVALLIFRPLAFIEFAAGYQVYLFSKVVCLAALTFLWFRYFTTGETERILLFLFIVVGFNQTVIRDLTTGNVSLFEQLFLWVAFFFLLRGKDTLFALCFFLATLMKPLVLLTLVPLSFVLKQRMLRPGSIIALLLIITHGLSAIVSPGLVTEFIRHVHLPPERLVSNPSSLEAMRIVVRLYPQIGELLGSATDIILHLFFAFIILATGALTLPRLTMETGLMGALVTYALLAPRFKDYSYILLIIPAVFIITRMTRSGMFQLMLVGLICTSVVVYQPILSALALFSIVVFHSTFRRTVQHEELHSTP